MMLQNPPDCNIETTFRSTFSTHLRAVTLGEATLDPVRNATDREFRKYYSKKIARLIYKGHCAFSFPSQRYKVLRSLSTSSAVLNTNLARSIKSLNIPYLKWGSKHHHISNMLMKIGQYKYLKSLEIPYAFSIFKSFFLRKIRTLNKLESLELSLAQDHLLENSSCILALKALKALKISVLKSNKRDNQDCRVLQLYLKLIRSKTLAYLKLDLQWCGYSSSLTNSLLEGLSQTSLSCFDIFLTVHHNAPIRNRYLNAALLQTDLFTLECQNVPSTYFECNTTRSQNIPLNQVKRKLYLQIIRDRNWEVPGINAFEPLKSVKELLANFIGSSIPVILELQNTVFLKSLSLKFTLFNTEIRSVEPEKHFADVLKVASNLEYLRLSKIVISSESDIALYEVIFRRISSLKSLRILEIVDIILVPDALDTILKPLQYLENLKKLYLNMDISLFDQSKTDQDISISFPESSNLTELIIGLPKINSKSQLKFIKAIGQLCNLEKLKISQEKRLSNKEWFQLMEILGDLKKLKEVDILINELFGKKYVEDESEIVENKKIAAELRDCGKKLFDKNHGLEKFLLHNPGIFQIKYERY